MSKVALFILTFSNIGMFIQQVILKKKEIIIRPKINNSTNDMLYNL